MGVLADGKGNVFARGLATYASAELEKLRGHNTREITEVLGYNHGDEAVHKDHLVLLG